MRCGQVVPEPVEQPLEVGDVVVGPARQRGGQPVEDRTAGPGQNGPTLCGEPDEVGAGVVRRELAVDQPGSRQLGHVPAHRRHADVAAGSEVADPHRALLVEQVQDAEAGDPGGERVAGDVAPEQLDLAQGGEQAGHPVARLRQPPVVVTVIAGSVRSR